VEENDLIEEIAGLPEGTLGFKITGDVTGYDYDSVLTPAIDKAIEKYDQIRLLAQVGPDFVSYSLDALWDDARLGLRHWNGFERVAVVTDVVWIQIGVKAMAFMMPCPVQLFAIGKLDDARRWLSESLGSIHIHSEGDVITVRLLGKLDPSAYDGVNEEIDNVMSHAEHVRLVLDLREFDCWSGLSALGNHLSLVREHYRVPERIAIVGDKAWHKMAGKIMARFVNARTKFFDSGDYEGAVAWVGA
jgi:SpoIIAA-like